MVLSIGITADIKILNLSYIFLNQLTSVIADQDAVTFLLKQGWITTVKRKNYNNYMEGDMLVEFNLAVTIPSYTEVNSTFPKPDNKDYNYWIALIKHFVTKSDTIEIHCWNEETEIIGEITSLFTGEFEMVIEEKLTFFKGTISPSLVDYLLNKSVNNNGELKWFTINLERFMLPVFHSGHWGTELFIPKITKEDTAFIKRVTPEESEFQVC